MSDRTYIAKQISDLIEPVLTAIGYELIDVEFLTDRGRWVLRIYIDKDGGITVDDCAKASNELGDLIDIKNVIEHEYVLEVSSPGLNRPLKKGSDFIKAIGKRIKVRTRLPVDGSRNFSGYLKDYKEDILVIESDGRLVNLTWPDIEKANLVYEFDD